MQEQAITTTQQTSYLDAAKQGHGSWIRYLIGTILIVIAWLGLGSVATVVLAIVFGALWGDFALLVNAMVAPTPEYVVPVFLVLMVSFIPFFLAIVAVVRFLHNRPVRTLVTGAPAIRWRRVGLGAGVWLALLVASLVIDILLRPELYEFQFNLTYWLPYTLLALLLIPIQSGSEELFFRGYLMQATRIFTRNPILVMLPSSLIFAALHLANPEVATNFWVVASYYLLFALFTAWISLKDGTIELALGMHIINNLTAIISTFPDSALPAPAPILKTVFEPHIDVVVFIIMAVIFYFIAFGKQALSGVRLNSELPAAPAE